MRIERVSSNSEVVSEKLRGLSGGLTWSDLFSRSKRIVRLKVRAEDIDFSRAQVFIGDINKKTKGAFAVLLSNIWFISFTPISFFIFAKT